MYEILVDMSLDIDKDIARDHDIRFIPMEYVIGDKINPIAEPADDDEMKIFYDKMRDKKETHTSQISPQQYIEAFMLYIKDGRDILCLCLSSGLSNTYESACLAAKTCKDRYPDIHIEVVDTLGATGGMGILATSAAYNREKGMSLVDNATWLRDHALNVHYYFLVEDLMYLMRGGRVSAATAVVGTALNIKPILIIDSDGKLPTIAKKRGRMQAMHYLIDNFDANYDPSIDNIVYICHADCIDDAMQLKKMALDRHPDADIKITYLCPVIGAHTGPGMLSIIYYGSDRSKA